jgi:cobalt-zinc-cadmium efflux system membrane fusion protein
MRRLLRYAPTFVVLALLAILGWQGHERGWRWEKTKEEKKAERTASEAGGSNDADDPQGKYGFSPFDSTLPIAHNPDHCALGGRVVKTFTDRDAVRKAGIFVGTVYEHEMDDILTTTATAEFDPTRIARVAPRVGGSLHEMKKKVGDLVEKGEILAIVDSPDVGKAKASFRMARLQLDVKQQFRDTLQSGVNPPRTIAEADAAIRESRLNLIAAHQALLSLGFRFDLDEVMKLGDDRLQNYLLHLGLDGGAAHAVSENLIPIINPLPHAGWVLKREGVAGEPVAAQQTLFVVGDNGAMILMIDVPQERRDRVRIGCGVSFYPDGGKKQQDDGNKQEHFDARIDWIAPDIDPKSRMIRARAVVEKPNGNLKANSFGVAHITVRDSRRVTAVSEEAIQWEGCSHILFVCEETDDKKTKFRVRKVTLGIRHDGFVEVLPGIQEKFYLDFFELISDDGFIRCELGVEPGERIAVLGSHVLKSELFRDRLGKAEE